MAPEASKLYVPLTCHGHSRPVTHINFSGLTNNEEDFYMISACKGTWDGYGLRTSLTATQTIIPCFEMVSPEIGAYKGVGGATGGACADVG